MMRTLRSYLFWTYERGSMHYDIMVTLILLFLFITPHLWNYGDRPNQAFPSQVMVDTDGHGGLVYQVRVSDVEKHLAHAPLNTAIYDTIEPIAGTVRIDRYQAIPGPDNKPVGYKVWAHR